jgi:hypothetical protein
VASPLIQSELNGLHNRPSPQQPRHLLSKGTIDRADVEPV